MIEDIFQVLTSHPALISCCYVYKDMIEDIFQVLTSHPALISSYNVYKDMIEDIFQVLTSHPALIYSDFSQLRFIIISREINSLAYNNSYPWRRFIVITVNRWIEITVTCVQIMSSHTTCERAIQ